MAQLLIPKIGFLREEIYILHAKVNPLICRLYQTPIAMEPQRGIKHASDIGATDASSDLSGQRMNP